MSEETKAKEKPRARRSINDLRAPIMMLYVFAFCGGRMAELPMWLLLSIMAPVIGVLAFVFERKLMMELLTFRPIALLAGLGAGALLYAIFAGALPLVSGFAIDDALKGDGAVPGLFAQLVAMKTHAAALHPAVVGLAGAVLLGFGEEIFWRGFVLTRLMLMMRHSFAILLTTGVYAGFYFVLMGPLAAATAGVAGFACALVTFRMRSVLSAVFCHASVWLVGTWIIPLY